MIKKIVVTGGSGFIGTNFIERISNKNFQIINIDKLSKQSSPEQFKYKQKNYKFYKLNLVKKKQLKKKLFQIKPDIIINFAAESHVDRSIDDPDNFMINNFTASVNLFTIFKDLKKIKQNSKFIHVSTDEVFGSHMKKSFKENSLYNPSSPYSSSKASTDLAALSFNKTYKTNIVIVNLCNCYGPFQHFEKFIPTCIFSLLKNKSLPLYGKGKNIREWTYVDDACDAIIKLVKYKIKKNRFNIGSGIRYKNKTIAKKIFLILKKKKLTKLNSSNFFKYVKDRPGHDFRYALNSSLFNKSFNFKNLVSLSYGLESTINWYLKNKLWVNAKKNKFTGKRLGLND